MVKGYRSYKIFMFVILFFALYILYPVVVPTINVNARFIITIVLAYIGMRVFATKKVVEFMIRQSKETERKNKIKERARLEEEGRIQARKRFR